MYIDKNGVISIVRFKCDTNATNCLYDVIRATISNEDYNGTDFNISYYINNGRSFSCESIYKSNIYSEYLFELNSIYFPSISKQQFCFGKIKYLLFEVLYDDFSDVIDLRFIYMIADYLSSINIQFQFRFLGDCGESGYIPIKTSCYHQIRTFLMLTKYNNNFWFLCEKTPRNRENINAGMQWQRAFKDDSLEERIDKFDSDIIKCIGRIVPMIPITGELYQSMVSKEENDENRILYLLLKKYRTKYISKEMNTSIISSDNCLEKLVFFAMCAYSKGDLSTSKSELNYLHERCNDISQGILQITENALFHVVSYENNEDNSGSGVLVFRIRKKDEAKYVKKQYGIHDENHIEEKKTSFLDDIKYFIEIYASDLSYKQNNDLGMVKQFKCNAKRRFPDMLDEFDIDLKDMFTGGVEGGTYRKYLQRPEVIAYHYGLQIFNNVVMSNYGYLYVRSYDDEYSNLSSEYLNEIYVDQSLSRWNGTAFLVYIPIRINKSISYVDVPLPLNSSPQNKSKIKFVRLFKDMNIVLSSYGPEEISIKGERIRVVNKLIEFCNVDKDSKTKDIIYYVDCIDIENEYSYECLAKAIFILMSKCECVNNVAIINVINHFSVIKLFREFALFYDREGNNETMNEKNIYLVDQDAELDIAFGGKISDIVSNMRDQLMWGGIGENVKEIIVHLGGGSR